jgi:hypothetical protein
MALYRIPDPDPDCKALVRELCELEGNGGCMQYRDQSNEGVVADLQIWVCFKPHVEIPFLSTKKVLAWFLISIGIKEYLF